MDLAAAVEQIDHAPVGELGHCELRDARQRDVDVEGRREHGARLAEELQPLLRGALGFGQRRLVDRHRDPVGDQLEQAHVLVDELCKGDRAGVDDADHFFFDDEGNRDDRIDAPLA